MYFFFSGIKKLASAQLYAQIITLTSSEKIERVSVFFTVYYLMNVTKSNKNIIL